MFQTATASRPRPPIFTSAATMTRRDTGEDVVVAPLVAHLHRHDAALVHLVHRELERQPETLHRNEHPQRQADRPAGGRTA